MIRRRWSALVVAAICSVARSEPAEVTVLPPLQAWEGESVSLALPAEHEWATPFERSGQLRTPRYDETLAWLERLVAAAPELHSVSIGRSAEGREIRMIIASREGAKSAEQLLANGRPTLLAQAGIHSGEIDGKDAGMMLLRDMTVVGKRGELLDQANLLFIPILSVDGHERFSRFHRINQRGPIETGWRTNGRNLNLNRDFVKLETEELRALAAAVARFRPDLYLDIHVTDGADYQYDVTYGYNGVHGWSPRIAGWLDRVLTPAVDADLERMGHVPGRLTFAANRRDMSGGTVDWTASPRFSNGWGDARHLPTVLVENHSLKPFRQRVFGTYVLIESVLRLLGGEHEGLRRARLEDEAARSEQVPLGWGPSAADPRPRRLYRGIRSELYSSPVTGRLNVRWTGEPVDEPIPVLALNRPTAQVRRPASYYIPRAWYPIVNKLELQGIEVERLRKALTVEVEHYRLPDAKLDPDNSPFEGRSRFLPGRPVVERRTVELPPESFRVTTDQRLGTLVVLLLEPESPDSLFQWGYFAEILQPTEYVESYIMEPMARAMLDADPELRAAFEEKLLSDSEFAASDRQRLQWFYEQTPFFDTEYRLYPVARSID